MSESYYEATHFCACKSMTRSLLYGLSLLNMTMILGICSGIHRKMSVTNKAWTKLISQISAVMFILYFHKDFFFFVEEGNLKVFALYCSMMPVRWYSSECDNTNMDWAASVYLPRAAEIEWNIIEIVCKSIYMEEGLTKCKMSCSIEFKATESFGPSPSIGIEP